MCNEILFILRIIKAVRFHYLLFGLMIFLLFVNNKLTRRELGELFTDFDEIEYNKST